MFIIPDFVFSWIITGVIILYLSMAIFTATKFLNLYLNLIIATITKLPTTFYYFMLIPNFVFSGLIKVAEGTLLVYHQ